MITKQWLIANGACWRPDRIDMYFAGRGSPGVTPRQVAEDEIHIPFSNRVWVLARAVEVLKGDYAAVSVKLDLAADAIPTIFPGDQATYRGYLAEITRCIEERVVFDNLTQTYFEIAALREYDPQWRLLQVCAHGPCLWRAVMTYTDYAHGTQDARQARVIKALLDALGDKADGWAP